jgi:hypothetical protein
MKAPSQVGNKYQRLYIARTGKVYLLNLIFRKKISLKLRQKKKRREKRRASTK